MLRATIYVAKPDDIISAFTKVIAIDKEVFKVINISDISTQSVIVNFINFNQIIGQLQLKTDLHDPFESGAQFLNKLYCTSTIGEFNQQLLL